MFQVSYKWIQEKYVFTTFEQANYFRVTSVSSVKNSDCLRYFSVFSVLTLWSIMFFLNSSLQTFADAWYFSVHLVLIPMSMGFSHYPQCNPQVTQGYCNAFRSFLMSFKKGVFSLRDIFLILRNSENFDTIKQILASRAGQRHFLFRRFKGG